MPALGKARQPEGEGRTLSFHTFHAQLAPVTLDNVAREIQAHAQTGIEVALTAADAIVALEDLLPLGLRDADQEGDN